MQSLVSDKQSLEKQLKKVNFDFSEKRESYERQISKLNEEVGFIKASAREQKIGQPPSVDIEMRENFKLLEAKFKEVKDKFQAKSKAFEDLEFESQQLKSTMNNLKDEVQKLSDSNVSERKEKHKSEMQLLETKSRLAETTVNMRQNEERCRQALAELDSLRAELSRQDDNGKNDKRRLMSLERELEEQKYTSQNKIEKDTETIASLMKQVTAHKQENESISNKLTSLLQESQSKSSKDQKDLISLQHKVRWLESRESDMNMYIDDLQKKLSFYKDQVNTRQTEMRLRREFVEKLAALLEIVRIIRDFTEKETLLIKQDQGAICSFILKNTQTYYESVRPKLIYSAWHTGKEKSKMNSPPNPQLHQFDHVALGSHRIVSNNPYNNKENLSPMQFSNMRNSSFQSPITSKFDESRYQDQTGFGAAGGPSNGFISSFSQSYNAKDLKEKLQNNQYSMMALNNYHQTPGNICEQNTQGYSSSSNEIPQFSPPQAHFTLGQETQGFMGSSHHNKHQNPPTRAFPESSISQFIPNHLKLMMSNDPMLNEETRKQGYSKHDNPSAKPLKYTEHLNITPQPYIKSPSLEPNKQTPHNSDSGGFQSIKFNGQLSTNFNERQTNGQQQQQEFAQRPYQPFKKTPMTSAIKDKKEARTPVSDLRLNKIDLSPINYNSNKFGEYYMDQSTAMTKDRSTSRLFGQVSPIIQPYGSEPDSFNISNAANKRNSGLENSLGLNNYKRERIDKDTIERENEEIQRRIKELK